MLFGPVNYRMGRYVYQSGDGAATTRPAFHYHHRRTGTGPASVCHNFAGLTTASTSQRMQVIVSTQSVTLVNEFSIDDLVIVEREQEATVFKRCDEEDFKAWLEDYSVGELWEKNILGGRPHK